MHKPKSQTNQCTNPKSHTRPYTKTKRHTFRNNRRQILLRPPPTHRGGGMRSILKSAAARSQRECPERRVEPGIGPNRSELNRSMHFSAEAARESLSLGLIFRSFSFGVGFGSKTMVLIKENHTFSISPGSLFIENVRKLMGRPQASIGAARTAPVPLDHSGGAPGGSWEPSGPPLGLFLQ